MHHVYSAREWCRSDWSRNDLSSWQTSERDERKGVRQAPRLRRRDIALEIATLLSCQSSHWPSVDTLRSRRDSHCVCNSAVLAWRVGSSFVAQMPKSRLMWPTDLELDRLFWSEWWICRPKHFIFNTWNIYNKLYRYHIRSFKSSYFVISTQMLWKKKY